MVGRRRSYETFHLQETRQRGRDRVSLSQGGLIADGSAIHRPPIQLAMGKGVPNPGHAQPV